MFTISGQVAFARAPGRGESIGSSIMFGAQLPDIMIADPAYGTVTVPRCNTVSLSLVRTSLEIQPQVIHHSLPRRGGTVGPARIRIAKNRKIIFDELTSQSLFMTVSWRPRQRLVWWLPAIFDEIDFRLWRNDDSILDPANPTRFSGIESGMLYHGDEIAFACTPE